MPTAETLQRLLAGCGYELVAAAGDRVVVIPPPGDDLFEIDAHGSRIDRGWDAETRARAVVGVLDAAEAIERGRRS